MLYQLREWQRAMLSPFVESSAFAANVLRDLPFGRPMAASLELFNRIGREYPKPEWALPKVEQVVAEKPFCRLLRFEGTGPKVLLFAPLSGHYATLLRETVRGLIAEHDVYVTDWVNARDVPVSAGKFGLDEYVAYAIEFMQQLGPDTHGMAVCQPTVPVLAAVSLMSANDDVAVPKTLTLMGGPIDPRESPTQVNTLATEHDISWFENNLIHVVPAGFKGAGRRVYPGFLQHLAFVSMNPDRHFKSHQQFFFDLIKGDDDGAEAHRKFYDEYNAVLDMTSDFYLETVKVVFQDHALPRRQMRVNGQLVDPSAITKTKLFTIEGELDDIAGLGQSKAALALCSSLPDEKKEHFEVPGAGHYGIFSGSKWREQVLPRLTEFFRRD
ncbi:MAG: polyhydroxyalkanoate depolymerase [Archangium sp.]